MARTSLRGWALLPVTLSIMLAWYGGRGGDVISFRPGPDDEQLWRCPRCHRVEQTRLPDPRCPGPPDQRHDLEYADQVSSDDGIRPSGGPNIFRR
jgi:hypothetical protein